MFKSHFTTAVRNLKRNKFFSRIHIAGLAIAVGGYKRTRGLGMSLIAMLELPARTLKSAMENPVKSLRTE
jgi:hypothetical protein